MSCKMQAKDLLFVAIGFDAFAVFVLRHFGATFFLDGTHGRAP